MPSARPTSESSEGSLPGLFSSPGARPPRRPFLPALALRHLQKHLEVGDAGAAMFYTCKTGMRSGMTVPTHSSWGLSACTAGPEGRWARSCPGSCCTSPGCSPRPSPSTAVCCSMAKRTAHLQAIYIIKGAGVKAAGTDTVVQFALLHLGSFCGFWVTLACSFLPSSGPTPDTGLHHTQGCTSPRHPYQGSAPGLIPMVDPRIAHSGSRILIKP